MTVRMLPDSARLLKHERRRRSLAVYLVLWFDVDQRRSGEQYVYEVDFIDPQALNRMLTLRHVQKPIANTTGHGFNFGWAEFLAVPHVYSKLCPMGIQALWVCHCLICADGGGMRNSGPSSYRVSWFPRKASWRSRPPKAVAQDP